MRERPIPLALGGLAAMAAAIGIGRFIYTPILPLMVEELGLSKAMAGFIASANFAGYLAGALLAATPLVGGSRRGWLLSALAVSGITTAAMAEATSPLAFLALRFVGGAASAFVLVFASALVLDRLARVGRAQLSSVHFAGVGVGIAVSAVLVAFLAALGEDWRALWLVGGLASLAAVAIVAVLIPADAEPASAARPAEGSGRGLASLVAAYGLFGFGYVITATFLVAIVRQDPAIRPLEPWIWIIVGLAALPSVPLWQWLGRRHGLATAFAIASIVEAAGVLASVEWTSMTGVCLSAVLLGGTFMGLTALGLMTGRLLGGDRPQRLVGLMTASFGAGQMIGPSFAGALAEHTGNLVWPSRLAAVALAIGAVLALASRDIEAS